MARVPVCQEEMMDFCSMNDMRFYEMDQPCLTKNSFPGLNHHAGEVGIQVKISSNTSVKGFQKAVVIVVAIEKMKKHSNARGVFTDDDLMDIISSVLEPVDFDTCEFTYTADSIYQLSRAISCNIQDIDHKFFVLNEPAQLVALHLQGPNISQAVRLKMYVYRPKTKEGIGKIPIALKIKGEELYLSCVQNGGQPVLQLEKANIQEKLDKSEKGRFLFYRVDIGNHTRFESAAFPHWYICTSAQPNEAVGMTDRLGEVAIVDYDLM
ncbi:interleukin-1 beta-like [Rhineura floridana]|uniref:interleukin-1 beta-like n=1 Tax=Rhineura floridana TaxID=261503 RepID=UPI002AC80949|nr:interleukin-1 beta-like [Rhineura floridana]XP_061448535.1 interleukin-1 beta-like [Rhineura floridana]